MDTQINEPSPGAKPPILKPTFPFRVDLGGRLLEGRIGIEFLKSPVEGATMRFLLPGGADGIQTDEIKLVEVSLAERKKRLQQLLIDGKIKKSIMLGDELEVVFQTRSVGGALDAALLPPDWELPKGVTDKWVGTFDAARTLASSIVTYAGREIGATPRECYEFVTRMSEPVFSYLVDEYNRFLAENRDLVTPKSLGALLPKS